MLGFASEVWCPHAHCGCGRHHKQTRWKPSLLGNYEGEGLSRQNLACWRQRATECSHPDLGRRSSFDTTSHMGVNDVLDGIELAHFVRGPSSSRV